MIASRLSRAVRAAPTPVSHLRNCARRGLAVSAKPTSPLPRASIGAAAAAAAAAAAVTARFSADGRATSQSPIFGLKVAHAAATVTAAESPAFKKAIAQADLCFDRRGNDGNLALAYTLLRGVYEEAERNGDTGAKAELCWRLARASYNLRSSKDPSDVKMFDVSVAAKKKELAELCEKYAREAVEVDPGYYRGYYWVGIAIQAVDEHQGNKQQIERLVSLVTACKLSSAWSSSLPLCPDKPLLYLRTWTPTPHLIPLQPPTFTQKQARNEELF